MSNEAAGRVAGNREAARPRRRRSPKPSCKECFFGCRGLCALELGGPCATFRPNRPEGLVPPRQPALLIRDPDDDVAVATG